MAEESARRRETEEEPGSSEEREADEVASSTGNREQGPSDTDAMGLDKRRQIVGQSYGPSLARQLTLYGLFLLFVVVLVVGAMIAINELDQPPDRIEAQAPWSDPNAPDRSPRPVQ
jgi:hypothetical protein